MKSTIIIRLIAAIFLSGCGINPKVEQSAALFVGSPEPLAYSPPTSSIAPEPPIVGVSTEYAGGYGSGVTDKVSLPNQDSKSISSVGSASFVKDKYQNSSSVHKSISNSNHSKASTNINNNIQIQDKSIPYAQLVLESEEPIVFPSGVGKIKLWIGDYKYKPSQNANKNMAETNLSVKDELKWVKVTVTSDKNSTLKPKADYNECNGYLPTGGEYKYDLIPANNQSYTREYNITVTAVIKQYQTKDCRDTPFNIPSDDLSITIHFSWVNLIDKILTYFIDNAIKLVFGSILTLFSVLGIIFHKKLLSLFHLS